MLICVCVCVYGFQSRSVVRGFEEKAYPGRSGYLAIRGRDMHVSTVSSSFLFIQPIAFQIYQRQPFEPRHLCTVLCVCVCVKPMSANAPSGNASIAGIKMRRTSRLRACPLQSLCVDARFVNRWGLCLSIHLASPRLSSPLLSPLPCVLSNKEITSSHFAA